MKDQIRIDAETIDELARQLERELEKPAGTDSGASERPAWLDAYRASGGKHAML